MSEINIMDIPVNLDLLIKKNKKDNSKNKGMSVNKKPNLIKGEIEYNIISGKNSPKKEAIKNKKLLKEEINILKNIINYKKKFTFPKNKILLFLDKSQSKNNFSNFFYENFMNHPLQKKILRDKYNFKQINKNLFLKIYNINKENINDKEITEEEIKFPIRKKSSFILFGPSLTKIPKYRKEHINHYIEMKYDSAKNAAVHARRLQYSYRIKPDNIKKKKKMIDNAFIIQKWWKSILLTNNYFFFTSKIQSLFRGFLTRKIISNCLHNIDDILPFINRVNNIYFKHRVSQSFSLLFHHFSLLKIYNDVNKKVFLIQNKFKDFYLKKRIIQDKDKIFSKPFNKKSLYSKKIFDYETYSKIIFIQKLIRGFLLRNNDKFMRKCGFYIHPFIYYWLKYKNDKKKFENKCKLFNKCFQRLRVFNLKVNKGIENEFEFFKKILGKKELKLIYDKLIYLFNNQNKIQMLVEYKFIKDYFKKWINIIKRSKCFKNMICLKNNQECKNKLQKLKRKSLNLQLPIILIKLENCFQKMLLKKYFYSLMKFSKPFVLNNIFDLINKNYIKENFSLLKEYYRNKKLESHFNKFFIRKYVNKWYNQILNVENYIKENEEIPMKIKCFKLNKIGRIIDKIRRKNNLKKFLTIWKKNIFINIQEKKLMEFKDKNILLIRFLQWKNDTIKFLERNKKLGNLINKINEINKKYCINTYLRKRFDLLKLHNQIYNNYVKPMNNLKLRLFINLIEDKIFMKKEFIHKTYFLTRLYQIFKSKDFYYGNKENIEKIKGKYLLKIGNQNDKKNLKESFEIFKNILKENRLNSMIKIYEYSDLKKYFDIWRNKKLYTLKKMHLRNYEKNILSLSKYLKEWLKRSKLILLKKSSKKISEFVSLKKFKKTRQKFGNKMIIHTINKLGKIIQMKIKGKHILRKKILDYTYKKLFNFFKHKYLKRVFDIVQNNLRNNLFIWNIQSKRKKKIILKSYQQLKELLFIRSQRTQFLKALNCIKNKNNRLLKNKFTQLRKNTEMNFIKIFHSNIQINFLYKNKKFIVGRKYRMLKYLIHKRENKLIYNLLLMNLFKWRYNIVILSIKDINDGKYGKITKYTPLFIKKRIQLGNQFFSCLLYLQKKIKERYQIN